jgi:hypothetical protein
MRLVIPSQLLQPVAGTVELEDIIPVAMDQLVQFPVAVVAEQ